MTRGRFFGSRLKDARLARGLTAGQLAERIGVTKGAVSGYETKDVEPRDQTFQRIVEYLDLPESFFLRQPLVTDPAPYLARSRAATTKRARERAEVQHSWLREIISALEAYVEFPKTEMVDVDPPSDPSAISNTDIELIANEVRKHWRLGDGPIPNSVSLTETMGCISASFAFGADDLSAFSQSAAEHPYILLNADECAAVRRRFNVAHELGHLVLHHKVAPADATKPDVHKLMERQAHRFAGAFLFPERSFADEVYSLSLDSLVQVKQRWRVSIQMMVFRAHDLNLISQDRYERLWREMSRRGYRRKEPLDEKLESEPVTLVARSIQMVLDERATTKEDLLHKMPFSPTDIEILSGLPRGYFSAEWGQVAELKLRDRPAPKVEGAGQVLEFRPRPKA